MILEKRKDVTGNMIGLPLVVHIATLSSHSAEMTQTWHSHPGIELLFVLEGSTAWEFQDGRQIEVAGGHFLAIPTRVIHRGVHEMRQPSSICGVIINPEHPESCKNTTFTKQNLNLLNQYFAKSPLSALPCSGELRSRLHRLTVVKRAYQQDQKDPVLRATMRTLICSILLEVISGLQGDSPVAMETHVEAAKKYLQEHIHEQVQMSDLVKHIGFSRSYLFVLFKSVTGMSPNDYFVRLRIERAQRLLIETKRSITAIALDTGFSSSQYFSTAFRKHTGKTAMEYRRRFVRPG